MINIKISNNREVVKKLNANDVAVSPARGGIRIAPHYYNRIEDVDTFLNKFRNIMK